MRSVEGNEKWSVTRSGSLLVFCYDILIDVRFQFRGCGIKIASQHGISRLRKAGRAGPHLLENYERMGGILMLAILVTQLRLLGAVQRVVEQRRTGQSDVRKRIGWEPMRRILPRRRCVTIKGNGQRGTGDDIVAAAMGPLFYDCR